MGREHSGRVRGLGIGPTPTQVFRSVSSTGGVTNNINGNVSGEVAELKTELQAKEERIKALEKSLQTQEDNFERMKAFAVFMYNDIYDGAPPPELASLLNSMVHITSFVFFYLNFTSTLV